MRRLFRRGRGIRPLVLLSFLCVGSAVLRLAGETGHAIAREVSDLTAYTAMLPESESCAAQSDVGSILSSLSERQARLDEAEAELARQQVALLEAQQDIAAQLNSLVAAEDSLRSTLGLAEGAAEADVARLTTVYERMKPKEAAVLFETMAPEFAAGFLGRMNPEAAAAILAGLTPESAYSLSAILAGRHAEVPIR